MDPELKIAIEAYEELLRKLNSGDSLYRIKNWATLYDLRQGMCAFFYRHFGMDNPYYSMLVVKFKGCYLCKPLYFCRGIDEAIAVTEERIEYLKTLSKETY